MILLMHQHKIWHNLKFQQSIKLIYSIPFFRSFLISYVCIAFWVHNCTVFMHIEWESILKTAFERVFLKFSDVSKCPLSFGIIDNFLLKLFICFLKSPHWVARGWLLSLRIDEIFSDTPQRDYTIAPVEDVKIFLDFSHLSMNTMQKFAICLTFDFKSKIKNII